MTITLYDIPSKLPDKIWSPNVLKVRMALNYKGIPFKVEWVEFPDIAALAKKIGAAPTAKTAAGHDEYTVPIIEDPKTGKVVSDSLVIAEYLDTTYPDTPKILPVGRAVVALFQHTFFKSFHLPLIPLMMVSLCEVMNPESAGYFRETREKRLGSKLEEMAPAGPKRDAAWAKVKEGLDLLARIYDENGKDKLFLLGDTFSYADAIMVSFLLWAKVLSGKEEWDQLAGWNDGRWGKFVQVTTNFHGVA